MKLISLLLLPFAAFAHEATSTQHRIKLESVNMVRGLVDKRQHKHSPFLLPHIPNIHFVHSDISDSPKNFPKMLIKRCS
jgi:hypothetical protein